MCALFFIGLGIHGFKGISLLGIEIIKQCEVVYLETYTSPLERDVIEAFSKYLVREIKSASREFIEDGRIIIEQAGRLDVALITPGDPMIATTHMDLKIRAEKKGIKTRVIHSSSILSCLPGEIGLHAYKFGKPVTITRSSPASLATVYNTVFENLLRGLHTILLLEYDYSSVLQLSPKEGIRALIECEEDLRLNIFKLDTFIIVTSRLGSPNQFIRAGSIRVLLDQEYGDPPHALIIPGSLHFTEVEALGTLLKIDELQICDNSRRVERIASLMVAKYTEKTKRALKEVHSKVDENSKSLLKDLLENAECYLSDSGRFLNQGKEELAILSIGYAEGLLDSLRYTHGIELNW